MEFFYRIPRGIFWFANVCFAFIGVGGIYAMIGDRKLPIWWPYLWTAIQFLWLAYLIVSVRQNIRKQWKIVITDDELEIPLLWRGLLRIPIRDVEVIKLAYRHTSLVGAKLIVSGMRPVYVEMDYFQDPKTFDEFVTKLQGMLEAQDQSSFWTL